MFDGGVLLLARGGKEAAASFTTTQTGQYKAGVSLCSRWDTRNINTTHTHGCRNAPGLVCFFYTYTQQLKGNRNGFLVFPWQRSGRITVRFASIRHIYWTRYQHTFVYPFFFSRSASLRVPNYMWNCVLFVVVLPLISLSLFYPYETCDGKFWSAVCE